MKILQALLLACSISFASNAQVVISPTGDGGFETGTTPSFASNGWTEVNPPTVIHQWVVGTASTPYAGTRGVYVSNNGSAHAYTPAGGARTCHFFRNVTIPAGATSITLSFYWKGQGDVTADRFFVSTAPTTITPAANLPVSPSTTIAGATVVWTQTTPAGGYTLANVVLPNALAGTTFRVIFSWQNDASGAGSNPPAAIDNISLTYTCTPTSPIVGSSVICEGDTAVMLSASPGGTWLSTNPAVGSISPAGTVTALSQGTTTISYTSSCAAPATVVVTVRATPSAIAGPSDICLMSSAFLTNTAIGGAWTSSSPTHVSVDGLTGMITGGALGTATITYGNTCGAPVSRVITVRPIPPANTGSDTVCEGGATITLTNTTSGGTWSSSDPTIATATVSGPTTGLVTGVSDGTATITYTSVYGCIATTTMSVKPLPPPNAGLAPMCIGDNIILSNSLPGGVWSSAIPGIASVASSGVVTGISGGTALISYTNGCGSATTLVTVDPDPLPIVGDTNVCVGSITTLANIIIGGSWSSANPAIATILPTSGIVTGIASGTARITYTMPGGCFITGTVNVTGAPGPIVGVAQACPGGTTLLSNTTPGGTWLSFNPGSATVATTTASSATVTGVAADTALIEYTTPAGCKVYVTVTINPLPSPIIGDSFYCATDIDTLYNPDPGGSWTSLTTSLASIGNTTGIMNTIAGGTVIIRYTLPTSCAITRSFTVHPLPAPSVGFDPATNTLSTGTGYETYQWYHSVHGEVVGAVIYKTAGIYNGSYYVVVTDSNGCEAASAPFNYNVSMGVGATSTVNEITIFPNPATGIVNIQAGDNVTAIVSSIEGKTVMTQNQVKTIDIAQLPQGVYLLSLYNADGMKIATEKLIKQ